MSRITSTPDRAGFNLDQLEVLAKNTGDTDKVRGKVNTNVLGKTTGVTLYTSHKAQGKFKEGQRTAKQDNAKTFVQNCLDNTLATMPHAKRLALTRVFADITMRHSPGQGELTGRNIKDIVADARTAINDYDHAVLMGEANTFINTHLAAPVVGGPGGLGVVVGDQYDIQASQINITSSYDEALARGGDKPLVYGSVIKDLSIDKHNQSVFRLPNKLNLQITTATGVTIQAARVMPDNQKPSREVFLASMFKQINTALGRPDFDIQDRVKCYGVFGTGGKYNHLDAFTNGVRSDGGVNQDVFLLKYATKEMAGFGIGLAIGGMQKYVKDQGLLVPGRGPKDKPIHAYSVGLRDQVDACHITLLGNGNFEVDSHLNLPLKNSAGTVIGSLKVSLHAEVDSPTGHTDIDVNVSNMVFNEHATAIDKQHMIAAFSGKLPGGL